jgi:hypothetical protein
MSGNIVLLVQLSSSTFVKVSDEMTLLPLRLKAYCSKSYMNCSSFIASPKPQILLVAAPSKPVSPSVSIVAPRSLGSCSDLVVDLSASVGSCGRQWRSVSFRVDSASTNASRTLQSSLAAAYRPSSPSTVGRGDLQPGLVYTITVMLCNFLQACSQGSVSVEILQLPLPSVTIVGGALQTTTRRRLLVLATAATAAICGNGGGDGSPRGGSALEFAWSVSSTPAASTVSSTSRDPSKFLAPAFSLVSGSIYTMTVKVTDSSTSQYSTAFAEVVVVSGRLVAVVAGGLHIRSLRLSSGMLLDGSRSYDEDQEYSGHAGVSFEWSCAQTAGSFLASCSLNVNQSTVLTSVLQFVADTPGSANSSSTLTLTVSDATRSATAAVVVNVVGGGAPLVAASLAAPAGRVNSNSNVLIVATIQALQSSITVGGDWTVDAFNLGLSSMALTAVSFQTIASNVFDVNLLLAPNALPPGGTFVFSLSYQAYKDGRRQVGSSSILIATNAPPAPGYFEVSPLVGAELSTDFIFSAFAWADQDLPITYEFGYGKSYSVLQARSQSSSGSSYLPFVGSPAGSQNFSSVLCVANIFDGLLAATSATAIVAVSALQTSKDQAFLQSFATAQLLSSNGNMDKTRQVISVLSAVINAANCSMSPDCLSLHRAPCSSAPHTCGGCLESFVGDDGNSNSPCVHLDLLASMKIMSSTCSVDADCGLWGVCDEYLKTCFVPSKTCPNDCSGLGVCHFVDVNTGASLSHCSVEELACSPVCVCDAGFNGAACDTSDAQLALARELRSQLIAGLSSVAALQNPDDGVVAGWAASLASLTCRPIELTVNSSLASMDVLRYAMGVAEGGAASLTSAATVDMYSSLDNIAMSSLKTARDGSEVSQQFLSAVDSMGRLIGASMVLGQADFETVHSSFRAVSSAFQGAMSVAMPLTALEIVMNVTAPKVSFSPSNASFPPVGWVASSSFARALAPPNVSSDSQLLSNPLRVQLGPRDVLCSGPGAAASSSKITLRVPHLYKHDALNTTNSSVATFCSAGFPRSVMESCPNGNITVVCDGLSNGVLTTRCPSQRLEHQCVVLGGPSSAVSFVCETAVVTAEHTVCECSAVVSDITAASMCAPQESSVVNGGRRLQSASGSADTAVLELVTVASSVAGEFASIMASAAAFDSAASLRASIVVIATFASLWVGIALVVWMSVAIRAVSFSKIVPSPSEDPSKQGAGSCPAVREVLRGYALSLIPSSLSTKQPWAKRMWNEVLHHHIYFSVLTEPILSKKWLSALEVLTNLTFNMFLLAMFYDVEWPSDDGSCARNRARDACLLRRSSLNRERTVCAWSESQSSCAWQKPVFEPSATIVVSLLVVLVGAPVYLLLSILFSRILKAPSPKEAAEAVVVLKERRRNAIAVTMTKKATGAASSAEALSKSPVVRPFSISVRMNDGLRKSFTLAHDSVARSLSAAANKSDASRDSNNNNNENFMSALLHMSDSSDLILHLEKLASSSSSPAAASFGELMLEAKEAERAAALIAGKIRGKSPAHRGVEILQLFLCDAIGRHSSEARVFRNISNPFDTDFVTTNGFKGIAMAVIVLLDLYFVFSCMLYGANKGMEWQYGWAIGCGVNFVLDVFVKQVNIALVVHYLVPSAILAQSDAARDALMAAIHAYCRDQQFGMSFGDDDSRCDEVCSVECGGSGDGGGSGVSPLSASSALFVSAHLARAFPDLLESQLVLSYRSDRVPFRPPPSFSSGSMAGSKRWSICLNSLSLVCTNILVMLGTCSQSTQGLVVSIVNPLFVAAIAFVCANLRHQPLLWLPACFAVLCVAALAYLVFQPTGPFTAETRKISPSLASASATAAPSPAESSDPATATAAVPGESKSRVRAETGLLLKAADGAAAQRGTGLAGLLSGEHCVRGPSEIFALDIADPSKLCADLEEKDGGVGVGGGGGGEDYPQQPSLLVLTDSSLLSAPTVTSSMLSLDSSDELEGGDISMPDIEFGFEMPTPSSSSRSLDFELELPELE